MALLEDALLDVLVCPIDKSGLLYFADDAMLYNPRVRRLYRSRTASQSCCPSWPYRCPTKSTSG